MRKVLIILTLLLIWYIAGMYRQAPIMSLVIGVLIFVVLLCAAAFYQRCHLRIRLEKPQDIGFKWYEKGIVLRAFNTGLLPVNRYRVKFSVRYRHQKNAVKRSFTGAADSKRQTDGTPSEFYLTPPYCGLVEIDLLRVKVYDTLNFFSFSKKLREHGELMIFPVPKQMNLILPTAGSHDHLPLVQTNSDRSGDDHSEVRLLREYRPGDLYRHVHHNYSAKTDTIWVKEFRKENDFIYDLFLDTSVKGALTPEQADGFYEIAASVVTNLCRRDIIVHVHWYSRETKSVIDFEVTKEADCAEMLRKLYLSDPFCSPEELSAPAGLFRDAAMWINTDLEWFFQGRPVFRFDPAQTDVQLTGLLFDLTGQSS